jgi:uncharacterized membrane protein
MARLWLKSISWRVISTITLFAIAWLCTGSVQDGGVVALIHMAITIALYIPHELAWDRLDDQRPARDPSRQRGLSAPAPRD